MDLIKHIERNQAKIIELLHEYQHAKRFQQMRIDFKTVYIIKDGFLFDQDGQLLVDTCNWYYTKRIKSYLRLRNVKDEQVLNLSTEQEKKFLRDKQNFNYAN